MHRRLVLAAIALTASAGGAQSPLERSRYDRGAIPFRPVETVEPDRGPVTVRLFGGGGPVDRYAPDRTMGYALIAVPLRSDAASLVLLEHDRRARIRARVLDRPPWADPAIALPVVLETRRIDRSGRRIAGAWLMLPEGEPPQDVVLLVETSAAPLRVSVVDREPPPRYPSVFDRWDRSPTDDLPSPIEADGWRNVQRLWPWPGHDPGAH